MALESTRATCLSEEDFKTCVGLVCEEFGFRSLKREQFHCIKQFISGRDVFVNMPTGWGKSLIFQMVPFIEMSLANLPSSIYSINVWRKKAILIVICPLLSLMKDQVNQLQAKGINASYVAVDQDEEVLRKIEEGEYNLVFMSPESSLDNDRWRSMLTNDIYSSSLVGIAVDEVHCVTQWGLSNSNRERTAFRKWYSRLNELRSLTHSSVPVMALTATAVKATKAKVFELLELRNPYEVMISPDRSNITYVVQKMENRLSVVDHFFSIIKDVREKGREAKRTIIYCQTIFQCSLLYQALVQNLGNDCYEDNDVQPMKRRIEMLHSQTPSNVKEHILEQFGKSTGHLRVLIATIAYGMGVNCKGVTVIIHFGPSKCVESYVQESGRGGRDGEHCTAILLYNGVTIRAANNEMKEYVRETSPTCRRTMLFKYFDGSPSYRPLGHNCCDKCAELCRCQNNKSCNVDLHLPVPQFKCKNGKQRTATEQDKEKLNKKLCSLHKKILLTEASNPSDHVGFPTTLMQFGKPQIQEIIENCNVLFSVSDIMEHVNIWQHKHAFYVLEIINNVFSDIENYEKSMSDSDSSREEDEIQAAYDDEWNEIMNDDSFLSLINLSDCNVETTVEDVIEEGNKSMGIPTMVESIISSHMDVED